MMVTSLERMGCRVDSAKDGNEAFRLAASARPSVILMDLNLPAMTGWEAIRNIRERDRMNGAEHGPYIVAHSAMGTADARREAFEAGCNEFVVKPLDVRGAIRAYALRHGHAVKLDAPEA